jgi:hypothetical protein
MEVRIGYRIQRQLRAGKPAAFFFQGGLEIYGPNILDPGEDMRIVIKLSPAATNNTTNLATVVTPNGAKSEITFGW